MEPIVARVVASFTSLRVSLLNNIQWAIITRSGPALCRRYISGRDSFVTSVRYMPSNWFIYVRVSELASAKVVKKGEIKRIEQERKRDERRRKGAFCETGRTSPALYTGFSGISRRNVDGAIRRIRTSSRLCGTLFPTFRDYVNPRVAAALRNKRDFTPVQRVSTNTKRP